MCIKMESDNSWSSLFSSSSSRRYQSRSGHFSQTTPDLFAHDETDGDDELKAEFLCPFCAEDFDVVGLCCHIDEEHPVEAKNGKGNVGIFLVSVVRGMLNTRLVCPVCAKRVGANLVSHITTQHGNYVQRKRKFRRGSNSTFSILRKELREGSLQALLGGSSFLVSSNTEADPLLSSFIYNPPTVDEDVSAQPDPLVETSFVKESTKEEFSESFNAGWSMMTESCNNHRYRIKTKKRRRGSMESDNSWSSLFSSSSSRRYQSRSGHFSQTTPDLFAHDETDGDDELKAEFLCPFCAEDFDVVGLCCHIDEEHPVEAKNGVCPVCAKRVGANLVSHITTQHGNHVQRKRKFRRGSNSTFSLLRKELREGSLQALLGGSSFLVSSNTEADPLLSSFIYNPPTVDEDVSAQPDPLVETSFVKESTKEEFSERTVQQPPLSHKDQEEKGRKCEFVQGLLMSTILDDL
ncbi:hypothetical protein ACE6H2_001202 [Prunus campanulata]